MIITLALFNYIYIYIYIYPPGQCTSPQLHLCHRLFDQDEHQDSSSPSLYSRPAPCDFWLFLKLRSCRYETIKEIKEAVTKVIDTITQENSHGTFQRLLERYKKCIAAGGDYFERDYSFMCVLSIKVDVRKKSGYLSYAPRSTEFKNVMWRRHLVLKINDHPQQTWLFNWDVK